MNLHPSFDQPGFQCLCERVISKPGYGINYVSFYNLCNPFKHDLRCASICGVEFVFPKERREKRAQRRSWLKGLQSVTYRDYNHIIWFEVINELWSPKNLSLNLLYTDSIIDFRLLYPLLKKIRLRRIHVWKTHGEPIARPNLILICRHIIRTNQLLKLWIRWNYGNTTKPTLIKHLL